MPDQERFPSRFDAHTQEGFGGETAIMVNPEEHEGGTETDGFLGGLDLDSGGLLNISTARYSGSDFKRLVQIIVDDGYSDVHLVEFCPHPFFRVARQCYRVGGFSNDFLTRFDENVLRGLEDAIEQQPILEKTNQHSGEFGVDNGKRTEFSFPSKGAFSLGAQRIRFDLYKVSGGRRRVLHLRFVPSEARQLEDLKFPDRLRECLQLCDPGLVLVSGGPSSGKSSTVASIVNWIRTHSNLHIRTFEDPIEYEYPLDGGTLVTQVSVGKDGEFPDYQSAVEAMLTQDVNVVVFGEIRDAQSIKQALLVASLNTLVIGTIHAPDVAGTVLRIREAFDAVDRNEVLRSLSNYLRVIVAQQLVLDKDEKSEGDDAGKGNARAVLDYEYAIFRGKDGGTAFSDSLKEAGDKSLADAIRAKFTQAHLNAHLCRKFSQNASLGGGKLG